MDKAIMLGRPVVPTEAEAAAGRAVGIDISDPYDNSVKEVCAGCPREVWVGPLQQKQRRDLGGAATVFCSECLIKYVAIHHDEFEDIEVTSLGNHHPRGN